MKVIYKILLITSVTTIYFSCSTKAQDESILEAEEFIEGLYNQSFNNWITETESEFNTIQLYRKIEEFYLSAGILNSIEKKSYKSLYKAYMQTDREIDLRTGLYESYPEIESLVSPSNYAISYYAFDEAMKKYDNKINHESSLYKVSLVLDSMYRMDFVFEEQEELFKKYINSISDEDFESKFIYRIPLVAFSHHEFASRYQKEVRHTKKD